MSPVLALTMGGMMSYPLRSMSKKAMLMFSSVKMRMVSSCLSGSVELQEFGVELYVYVAEPKRVFHPKIYYGTTNARAWV